MAKKIRLDGIEKVQAQQDKLAKKYGSETPLYGDITERYHTAPSGGKPMHWFLWAYTPKGRVTEVFGCVGK